jgi:flagellar M-ring protein FliF
LPLGWLAVGAGGLLLLGAIGWRRMQQPEAIELSVDDFEVELDTARNQALLDPRVTADVIKLWMRA